VASSRTQNAVPRLYPIGLLALALATLATPGFSFAAAPAVRVLPGPAAAGTDPVTISRLSAVTSEDSKRAIVAWDIAEAAAAHVSVSCRWLGRGSGRVVVSSRAGWSHRVSCDGKRTKVGTASGDAPTVEVYYAGSSKKGLTLTLQLATSRGFATPFGDPVVPTISFKMASPGTSKAASDAKVVPQSAGGSSFESLIPEGLRGVIQKSPFYKYLKDVDLSQFGL